MNQITGSQGIIGRGAKAGSPHVARGALNISTRMIFAATGVPQVSQPIFVPPGCNVYVRGSNGTPAGNTGPVRIGLSREAVSGTQGDVIFGTTDVSFPVDNTGQIWAAGAAGDGLIIAVRSVATQ
jgi:hypothetical protein